MVMKSSRGEWYLVVQAGLFLLLFFGPHSCCRIMPRGMFHTLTGGALFVAGLLLAATGAVNLGKNLTPLPVPKEHAQLVVTGAYRLVRHPIYSGIIFMAFGWGLWVNSWLTIGYAGLLFAFFDCKSRREEQLLKDRFPHYEAYRKRVRKLLPFLY